MLWLKDWEKGKEDESWPSYQLRHAQLASPAAAIQTVASGPFSQQSLQPTEELLRWCKVQYISFLWLWFCTKLLDLKMFAFFSLLLSFSNCSWFLCSYIPIASVLPESRWVLGTSVQIFCHLFLRRFSRILTLQLKNPVKCYEVFCLLYTFFFLASCDPNNLYLLSFRGRSKRINKPGL